MITLPSGRKIGEGQPPFIVAEVGSNWRTLDECLLSISHAKLCGADAVKFQLYNEQALYGGDNWHGFNGLTQRDGKRDTLSLEGQLPLEWLPKLKTKADAVGIEFMCSAFSPELVEAVDPFVNIHKVASAEMTHVRILEKLSKIGKPVILSTGASGEADIKAAIETLTPTPTVLLYCVAAYPAREVALGRIESMEARFGLPIGFSDHTTDTLVIPRAAVSAGAVVLEKHVNFAQADGPDSAHSLSTDEFRRMVASIRGDKRATGGSPQERGMILRHNRRLIATQDIQAGQTLLEGKNFGIYRSLKDDTHALGPFAIHLVLGKSAKRAIKAGDGIGPGDF